MEAAGGGVVYFPVGSYHSSYINLGANVVLEGQNEYNTQLIYNGSGGGVFIKSKGTGSLGGKPQLQGIANLSILLTDPININLRPDVFIQLGDTADGLDRDKSLRQANRIFLSGVNLNYPYNIGNSSGAAGRRGIGVLWTANERVLMNNNRFTGWMANNQLTYLNQYCILKSNRFEYAAGYVHDTADYLFYEHNFIKAHPEYNQDSHGYFCRANAYMEDNYVEGVGDASNVNNDGEAYCNEVPNGAFNYGAVSRATTTNITVAPVIALTNPLLEYGTLSVAITQGTGLGQLRAVSSINTKTGVINISPAFEVVPDATSKFTLYSPLARFTVFSNTCANCAKGIWGFGSQYDAVFADNTTIDCNGIILWSARSGPPAHTNAVDVPDYFTRITRNIVVGQSRRSHQGGIGIATGRFDSARFFDVEAYATEITGNNVSGNNTVTALSGTEAPYYNGIYVSSYPYSTLSDGTGTGDATATLIANNRLSNLKTGIVITKCNYGQLIISNSYDPTVLNLISKATGLADNTIINSNKLMTATVMPTIMNQPQNQFVQVTDTPTFYIRAAGMPLPFYQWFKNNVAISGATGASFTPSPVALSDNGTQFSVMVSNSAGSVTSSNAILSVAASQVAPTLLRVIPPP